nr:zinc knuckle CX2CX4HX4C [Tanacetum cinerariifolium]
MDSLVVVIPFQNGLGNSMETIDIKYEWQPPCCDTCKIFDHVDDQCPMKAKVVAPTQVSDDGFVEVTRKHGKENKSVSLNTLMVLKEIRKQLRNLSLMIFIALEEDNGKLVDDTRKNVKAPPKKTPRKTGIWSSRKWTLLKET